MIRLTQLKRNSTVKKLKKKSIVQLISSSQSILTLINHVHFEPRLQLFGQFGDVSIFVSPAARSMVPPHVSGIYTSGLYKCMSLRFDIYWLLKISYIYLSFSYFKLQAYAIDSETRLCLFKPIINFYRQFSTAFFNSI